MNKPYYNDQAYIAQSFRLTDDFTRERAKLAYFKINSYKLSLINSAFCITRDELTDIIKKSLLNYIAPSMVLCDMEFFSAEVDN